MSSYDNQLCRLASFKEWPLLLNSPGAYSFATAGLFYEGKGDEVYCYKCRCCINNWKEGDVPMERHKLASPHCPLVPSDPPATPRPEDNKIHIESVPSELPDGHMKLEAVRLRTFDNWRFKHVTRESLARAGFFSMNIGDCVKCAFCHRILKQWEPGDVPFDEHRKYYPHCPFVRGLPVGNIPLEQIQILSKDPMNPRNSDVRFSALNQRRSSFINHIHLFGSRNTDTLAEAGFYYVGPFDSIKCFSCGGVLRNWSQDEDPWTEHAKWFPHCEFLLTVKGRPFALKCLDEIPCNSLPVPTKELSTPTQPSDEDFDEITTLKQPYLSPNISNPQPFSNAASNNHSAGASSSSSSSTSSSSSSSSAAPVERLKIRDEETANSANKDENTSDTLICKICMDETANTVFLPCGHLLCCELCAPAVSECPVCRGIIKTTLKIYIA